MKDLKITGGEWKKRQSSNGDIIISGRTNELFHKIATVHFRNESDTKDLEVYRTSCLYNANLIIDAGNTYQSTGMTASELAANRDAWVKSHNEIQLDNIILEKQRDELLEALKKIVEANNKIDMRKLAFPAIQSAEQKQS